MPAGPISWVIGVLLRKSLREQLSWSALLTLSSRSFRVSDLTLRPLIHLELVGGGGERRIKFHFSIWRYPVFPIPFVMTTFLWCVFLASCKKNSGGSRWVDLYLGPRVYSTNQWTCSRARATFDYSDFAVTWNYEQKCLQHSFCCSGLLWLVRVFRASI